MTLDPNYKHPGLTISKEKKQVTLKLSSSGGAVTPLPTLAIVGTKGYVVGKHYWEVRVGDGLDWELGVLTKLERNKAQEEKFVKPFGEGCWAVRSVRGDLFSNQDEKTPIEKKDVSYSVIGMLLDKEVGTISFYNAELMFHIKSIPIKSKEKLYPFLSFCQAAQGKDERCLEIIPIGVLIPIKNLLEKQTISDSANKKIRDFT